MVKGETEDVKRQTVRRVIGWEQEANQSRGGRDGRQAGTALALRAHLALMQFTFWLPRSF